MRGRSWLVEAGPLGWVGFATYVVAAIVSVWVAYRFRSVGAVQSTLIFAVLSAVGHVLILVALGVTSGLIIVFSFLAWLVIVAGLYVRLRNLHGEVNK